ncbi:MAG: phenylalanine--tRNA ligase subunit beta [Candidatus Berkelbacteria bacterium]|nr:phenylalanine--tRNA ligase subunit beta [Candidatus Berkelbacteria bacterium]
MKYLFSWLKKYYKTDKSAEQIGEDLVLLGSDVENIGSLNDGEIVLDLEITPNRGDLLSHFGLARDLSAKAGKLLEKPAIKVEESDAKTADQIKVIIESEKCSQYLARIIKGVKIAESPQWLQEKLIAVGAKPINNVVDITNYIMLDLGHPLHAFDKSKITGDEIIVKEINSDTEVVTLDGEARELIEGVLTINDKNKPIAIAGVMGLKNSEVDQNTVDIVLEAAEFDRKSIRRTAKILNLKTEASTRFERGVDSGGVQYAIDKAAQMISEIAGGKVLGETAVSRPTFVKSTAGKQPSAALLSSRALPPQAGSRGISIEYDKINSYADLKLTEKEIDKILENLGFEVEACPVRDSRRQDGCGENNLKCESASVSNGVKEATIPLWRHDIAIWQDLAEEIYRINGLEKINPAVLLAEPTSTRRVEFGFHQKEAIKDVLVEMGIDEAISYTFLSDADAEAAKIDSSNLVEVANPVQEEIQYLRNSLIPGLLRGVAKNPSFDDIELFELGNVFSKFDEWTSIAIVTAGKSARKAKIIVDELCKKFAFDKSDFNLYEINQEELKRFKIKKPTVFVAEAKIADLLAKGKFDDLKLGVSDKKVEYRPISKFPPVKRDLAFVVDNNIESAAIRNSILKASENVILSEVFDEFSSDKLGKNKKNIAFHIWLESLDKTLSDAEADEIILKIVSELEKKFGAKIRS